MKIPVILLGTGQAIPTAERNHVAVLLQYGRENILIDCGEGTQRQFRKARLNPCKLTKILITHWHGDHILGLPGLLQTLAFSNYNRILEFYIPKGTKKYFNMLLKFFVFEDKIKIKVKEVENGKIFENNDFYLETIPLIHGTKTNAYAFVEKNKLKIDKKKLEKFKIKPGKHLSEIKKGKNIKINGKLITAKDLTYGKKGKKISFVFDTKYCENAIKISENSDLLVCESTYSNEDKEKAKKHKHLTAEQAGKIAKKAGAKKLLLLHISQKTSKDKQRILKEAKKLFKNTILGKDLMKVEV